MTLLIRLHTNDELISYEALSLAFVLASFGQQVSIYLAPSIAPLLQDQNVRAFGMLQAATLYDIETICTDDGLALGTLPQVLLSPFDNTKHYDSILTF